MMLDKCTCGADFLLTEQFKPGEVVFACRIRCRECGRFSWGVGLTQTEANDKAKERWNSGERINVREAKTMEW